jgi:hypothetical protein
MRLESMLFFAETIRDIGVHTLRLMNSTYPSTIGDKSCASIARALAKNSVSEANPDLPALCCSQFLPALASHPWKINLLRQLISFCFIILMALYIHRTVNASFIVLFPLKDKIFS